jgi:hypothetical protein
MQEAAFGPPLLRFGLQPVFDPCPVCPLCCAVRYFTLTKEERVRKGRARTRAALAVAGAIAALGIMAAPAQAWPGCEQWTSDENCQKYWYGPQEDVGEITTPLWYELYETEDEAVETVLWAVDTYNGIYNCTVPWGYCPE